METTALEGRVLVIVHGFRVQKLRFEVKSASLIREVCDLP
mgnify:CR=1 FL=1